MPEGFKAIYLVTNCTKLRDFQFRMLHGKIPTNKELYKWKIKSSPNCRCGEEDSLVHTFYECVHAQKLWKELEEKINNDFPDLMVVFTLETILLNKLYINWKHVVNLFCLIMKQLIYRHKCLLKEIHFVNFLQELNLVRGIEYVTAKRDNMLEKHNRKWNPTKEQRSEHEHLSINFFIRQYIDKI